jgi:hypothetical protein
MAETGAGSGTGKFFPEPAEKGPAQQLYRIVGSGSVPPVLISKEKVTICFTCFCI